MTLPAKAQWRAASDKEVASLKTKQRLHPPAGDLCPRATRDCRLQMGLQGQGRQLAQGTRCRAKMGAISWHWL